MLAGLSCRPESRLAIAESSKTVGVRYLTQVTPSCTNNGAVPQRSPRDVSLLLVGESIVMVNGVEPSKLNAKVSDYRARRIGPTGQPASSGGSRCHRMLHL